jgi:hypothetical protein
MMLGVSRPRSRHLLPLLALCAGAAQAASPACDSALAALRAEEDAAIASRARGTTATPPPARLLAQRRVAARACLGSADAPRPATAARPPVVVPGIVLPTPAPAATAAAPAPPQQRALLTVTGCDALGCWASDGTRLVLQGQQLLGPRGACMRQGDVLTCP